MQGIHGSALTVNAIICLLSLTHWARSEILRSRSSGGSKYSLVSSSLRAVLAMVWAGCRILNCRKRLDVIKYARWFEIWMCTASLSRVLIPHWEPGNDKTQQWAMGWQRWRCCMQGVGTKNSNTSPTPFALIISTLNNAQYPWLPVNTFKCARGYGGMEFTFDLNVLVPQTITRIVGGRLPNNRLQ